MPGMAFRYSVSWMARQSASDTSTAEWRLPAILMGSWESATSSRSAYSLFRASVAVMLVMYVTSLQLSLISYVIPYDIFIRRSSVIRRPSTLSLQVHISLDSSPSGLVEPVQAVADDLFSDKVWHGVTSFLVGWMMVLAPPLLPQEGVLPMYDNSTRGRSRPLTALSRGRRLWFV